MMAATSSTTIGLERRRQEKVAATVARYGPSLAIYLLLSNRISNFINFKAVNAVESGKSGSST